MNLNVFFFYLLLCRGFAFVHFAEKESVDRVLEDGPHTLDEREIDVKKAIPHAQHQVRSIVSFPYLVPQALK